MFVKLVTVSLPQSLKILREMSCSIFFFFLKSSTGTWAAETKNKLTREGLDNRYDTLQSNVKELV